MEVRINKFLSEAGVCSRREADRLVESGVVTIDGQTASMGSKVAAGQSVAVRGKQVIREEEKVLLAFHKPVGIVCTTTDKQGKNNVVDYIGYHKRIYPVGRLDKDSEGLILMTNDGEMMNRILRSVNGHEKEYVVRVDKPVTQSFLEKMQSGIYLKELDRITKPCKAECLSKFTFRIVLTQGLNRQIRRMCDSQGFHVQTLKRVRIMNILLGELKPGQYRAVTQEERSELFAQLGMTGN